MRCDESKQIASLCCIRVLQYASQRIEEKKKTLDSKLSRIGTKDALAPFVVFSTTGTLPPHLEKRSRCDSSHSTHTGCKLFAAKR